MSRRPWHWRRGLLLVLAPAFCLYSQAADPQAKRTFKLDSDVETPPTWTAVPRWTGDLLVGYERNHSPSPILFAIDREGRREETLFTLQGAAQINLYDIAASSAGEIAVVGSALTVDTRGATFLARIGADRKMQTVTRTWPYCPLVLTFAPDGSLWSIGDVKDGENTRVIERHVLKHFDRSGNLLGSATVRSRGTLGDETSHLMASRDRVGWFTRGGEYIEFALDGSEIGRYDGPDGPDISAISGVALSPENDVVAGRFGSGRGKGNGDFVALDRQTRTWVPVSVPKEDVPTWAQVLGFDGTTLVTTTLNGRMRRFKTR